MFGLGPYVGYSFIALIFALTYWLASPWADNPRDRWLAALGLVVGVGVVHHRTAFILPPAVALWVFARRRDGSRAGMVPHFDAAAGHPEPMAALIPLLSYLYLPWAAAYRQGKPGFMPTPRFRPAGLAGINREWWGLVKIPTTTTTTWWKNLSQLFRSRPTRLP
ncbi:MAG: DUF2723 domain-containing protein [Anaerolineae bacterium]